MAVCLVVVCSLVKGEKGELFVDRTTVTVETEEDFEPKKTL